MLPGAPRRPVDEVVEDQEDGPDEHLDRVGRPVEVPDAGGRAKTRGEVKPQKQPSRNGRGA